MLQLYITIVNLLPYISYEDPVQLTTTTTSTSVVADPYHTSFNEVCTIINIDFTLLDTETTTTYQYSDCSN